MVQLVIPEATDPKHKFYPVVNRIRSIGSER